MNPPFPRSRRTARLLIVPASLALTASACGGTTYDATFATTATTADATTTTVPTGSASELLPVLRTEAYALSGVMIDEGDDESAIARIVALWGAAKTEVGQQRPDLLPGFEQNIALAEKAVEFSRAADADKAAKNLDALVTSFLGA